MYSEALSGYVLGVGNGEVDTQTHQKFGWEHSDLSHCQHWQLPWFECAQLISNMLLELAGECPLFVDY